ncbi:MAG: hypothetical protein ACYSUG_01155 [Planctomycetota bacterium]
MKHKKKEPNPVNKQGLTTCHPGPDPGPRAFLGWMPDQCPPMTNPQTSLTILYL